MDSQTQQIKEYLESGNALTPLEALYKFGCFRLGARIYDLRRMGFKINSEIVEITSPSKNGKKHISRYKLIKES